MQKPILIEDLGMLYATNKSKKPSRFGLFKCCCGNEFKTTISSIKSGTKSCGCLQKIVARQTLKNHITTHNFSGTRLHKIWKNIKQRCLNKNNPSYQKWYGTRGITMCDEWKNDFMSFYNWSMDNGYSENLSIDRIDNDGNYEANNCRWVTRNVQTRNISITKKNTSGYKNVSKTKHNRYVSYIVINKKRIHLGSYATAKEAAIIFNQYVIANKLEHTLNKIDL